MLKTTFYPMELTTYHDYCLAKKEVTATTPFSEDLLVYKVMGKIFAMAKIMPFDRLTLKCDPAQALRWRQDYQAVTAGYHMHKKHWNTVMLHQGVDDKLLLSMTDHAYQLIVQNLPRSAREKLS